jgi:thiol-disulfide isomerase/thioredoxin
VTLTRTHVAAGLALLAGLAVLYLILARTVHAPPEALANLTPEAARPAPPVTFVDATGKRHSLNEFRGGYVLLNLWGTWCAPCARELPALARLSKELPNRLAVIAVALPPGDARDAKLFLAQHDAGALGVFVDSQTMFFRAFRAYALPLTMLIDPKGNEIARAVGPAQWDAPAAVAYLKAEIGRQKSEVTDF